MRIGRRMLALDLVGLSVDQNGKHVVPCEHCVYFDISAVQQALPAGFLPLQFEPEIFPINGDVVDHKKQMRSRIF